jgi:hypothetical protein
MDDCVQIPRDETDPSFVKSFKCETESLQAIEFFTEYGFVVFSDVYSAEECATTRDAMWKVVESEYPGLDRNNMATWDLYKSTGKYGMSMRGPCFDPVLVRNRSSPNLVRVLKTVVSEDVMVSHDRYTIFRATVASDSKDQNDKFRTGARNIHLDLNPWWFFDPAAQHSVIKGINSLQYEDPHDFIKENNYVVGSMGLHVQCILNFADNRSEDGGTVLCPKFQRHIEEWCSRDNPMPSVTEGAISNNIHLKGNMPWLTFDRFPAVELPTPAGGPDASRLPAAPTEEGAFPRKPRVSQKEKQALKNQQKQQQLHDFEEHAHSQLLGVCHRVPMRAGCVLIWNQVLFHGTAPNTSPNSRYAQYIKAFPRHYDMRLPSVRHADSEEVSFVDYSADHNARLLRRATTLYGELLKVGYFGDVEVDDAGAGGTKSAVVDQGLLQSVNPDTLRLFGLDVLLTQ